MTLKRTARPRDPVQLGKLMLDIATGVVLDGVEDSSDIAAKRAGGAKGGPARAKALTARQRSEIASVAAQARWKKT